MSDVLKILGAIGMGIYTAVGLHFYSLLVSRTKNALLVLFLYVACIILVIDGGFVGCGAIMGALYDTGQSKPPNDHQMRLFIFIAWIGTVWTYIIFSWDKLMKRLKVKL